MAAFCWPAFSPGKTPPSIQDIGTQKCQPKEASHQRDEIRNSSQLSIIHIVTDGTRPFFCQLRFEVAWLTIRAGSLFVARSGALCCDLTAPMLDLPHA
jgi:hypothetical protein